MKKQSVFIMSVLLASGCGFKKNPVGSDLNTIRAEGKQQMENGPVKPTTVTNTVVVEKPQVVTREESTIDDKFLVITPDPQMSFNEGQTATYNIRARVLVPGVQISLSASGLPAGATLTASTTEKDLYILSWTPELYTIPANSNMKAYGVKLTAQVSSASANAQDAEKLKGLVREQDISLFLFRNQELPSELKIAGLDQELSEGQVLPFTVTAKVPGVDDKTPVKPRLVVSYDGVSYTAGNNYLELDGSRYVVVDLNKKDAVYLGNEQWQFSLLFDTKNISVQPELAKDGSILANADGTRVRVSFKVYSPYGLSTPDTLSQIKIKYNHPAAAADATTGTTSQSVQKQGK